MEIIIKTAENEEIKAVCVDRAELNKIARKNNGLLFVKNVMDEEMGINGCYMWFRNMETNEEYLLKF